MNPTPNTTAIFQTGRPVSETTVLANCEPCGSLTWDHETIVHPRMDRCRRSRRDVARTIREEFQRLGSQEKPQLRIPHHEKSAGTFMVFEVVTKSGYVGICT